MWDERYRSIDFAYGQEPNDFLVEQLATGGLAPGRALCLAEGEGRNALHLARAGWTVTGVDQSRVGLEKFSARASSDKSGTKEAYLLLKFRTNDEHSIAKCR